MMREFRAMGADWWLLAEGCDPTLFERAVALVEEHEQRFSRFRPDSALSLLNERRSLREPALARVVREALAIRDATGGAFDPAVGTAVRLAGYDRSFEQIGGAAATVTATAAAPIVHVAGDLVQLVGEGTLDLGGIAKGWTVDRVADLFEEAGASRYVVDGGGDIRTGGGEHAPERIALEESGLIASLRAGAVATSSTQHRRWRTADGWAHHIIDPRRGLPSDGEYTAVCVIAKFAAVADALATALIAQSQAALPALQPFGAEALLCDRQGAWTMTAGLERSLC